MDYESWLKGYETGVMLHNHLRDGAGAISSDGIPLSSVLVASVFVTLASMSVTGIAADLECLADLSGVETLTLLTADYSGNVTACYGYYEDDFTEPVPMAELLAVNPAILFSGVDPSEPLLYFRFHLADANANLNSFQLYGVPKEED